MSMKNDPTRDREIAAVAEWLDYARREGIVEPTDPVGMISDLEVRWERVFTSVEPETGLALLEARASGALPAGVVYAHIVGMAEYDDGAIAREIFAWLERAAELAGEGGNVTELTESGELGRRARRELAYSSPKLAPLSPGRSVAAPRWRGVPSAAGGRHVEEPVSGRVPRPDDPRFQAEVRAIDAAMRKFAGRKLAAQRARVALEKMRAAGVSVIEHRPGTPGRRGPVTAGISRRKRKRKR